METEVVYHPNDQMGLPEIEFISLLLKWNYYKSLVIIYNLGKV